MKEITYKEWCYRMAEKLGVNKQSIPRMVNRGKLKVPPVRRVNSRVVYVQVEA